MSATLSALVQPLNRDGRVPALYVGLSGDAPRSPPARIGLGNTDRVDFGRGGQQRAVRSSVDGVDSIALTLVDARMSGEHAVISRTRRSEGAIT